MRDRDAVLLAVAAALGAIASWPLPRWVGVAIIAAGLSLRRALVLVVGVTLLACALGTAARDGLKPVPSHSFHGEVELVSDPVGVRGGVRVDVRADGRRYEATARGPAARAIRPRASGDRVVVEGKVVARRESAPWLDARHIVAKLEIHEVAEWGPGSVAARLANGTRSILARGADALPRQQRPLYTGMVYGDDRGQEPLIVDDLRAAGLGHLLAVSGQNVAVVLGAARPLLERVRYRVRFPATLALLGMLLLVTRAEPSILRAAVMSGVVALAAAMGRSTSSLRVLALAVAALVLVDPLLVESVGFRLSVAASAGIVLLATPIAVRLPGPRVLAETMAVTLAAQVAVAPVALSTFGGLPVASLPANVVAAPVSGPLMIWGVTAGVIAGVIGGPIATLIHIPTRVMLWWIELVGSLSGQIPLGELQWLHLLVLVPASLVVLGAQGSQRTGLIRLRRTALVVAVGALLAPAVQLRVDQSRGDDIALGLQLWRDGAHAVVIVDGRADPVRSLEALRRAGVRQIDVIVARTGGRFVGDVVRAADGRYGVGAIWAPVGHEIRGATVPTAGTRVLAGPFVVTVDSVDPRLDVRVHTAG